MRKKMSLVKLSKNRLQNVKAGAVDACGCSCYYPGVEVSTMDITVDNSEGGLYGGPNCYCGCLYAGSGGSSTSDNSNANIASGLESPH